MVEMRIYRVRVFFLGGGGVRGKGRRSGLGFSVNIYDVGYELDRHILLGSVGLASKSAHIFVKPGFLGVGLELGDTNRPQPADTVLTCSLKEALPLCYDCSSFKNTF